MKEKFELQYAFQLSEPAPSASGPSAPGFRRMNTPALQSQDNKGENGTIPSFSRMNTPVATNRKERRSRVARSHKEVTGGLEESTGLAADGVPKKLRSSTGSVVSEASIDLPNLV